MSADHRTPYTYRPQPRVVHALLIALLPPALVVAVSAPVATAALVAGAVLGRFGVRLLASVHRHVTAPSRPRRRRPSTRGTTPAESVSR